MRIDLKLLNERQLTPEERKKSKEFFDQMVSANKKGFIERYGKDAEKVMTGKAIQQAKKATKDNKVFKLKEQIKGIIREKLNGTKTKK